MCHDALDPGLIFSPVGGDVFTEMLPEQACYNRNVRLNLQTRMGRNDRPLMFYTATGQHPLRLLAPR